MSEAKESVVRLLAERKQLVAKLNEVDTQILELCRDSIGSEPLLNVDECSHPGDNDPPMWRLYAVITYHLRCLLCRAEGDRYQPNRNWKKS